MQLSHMSPLETDQMWYIAAQQSLSSSIIPTRLLRVLSPCYSPSLALSSGTFLLVVTITTNPLISWASFPPFPARSPVLEFRKIPLCFPEMQHFTVGLVLFIFPFFTSLICFFPACHELRLCLPLFLSIFAIHFVMLNRLLMLDYPRVNSSPVSSLGKPSPFS